MNIGGHNMHSGEELRKLREKYHVSIEDVSIGVGMHPSTVIGLESGHITPTEENIERIKKFIVFTGSVKRKRSRDVIFVERQPWYAKPKIWFIVVFLVVVELVAFHYIGKVVSERGTDDLVLLARQVAKDVMKEEGADYVKKDIIEDIKEEGVVEYTKRCVFPESNFRGKTFILSSRYHFKPGDHIVLDFKIFSNGSSDDFVQLCKDRWKSLFLAMGPPEKVVDGPELGDQLRNNTLFNGRERWEKVPVGHSRPAELSVEGTISRHPESGNIVLDFDEFGTFEMLPARFYYIQGVWREPKPTIVDYVENPYETAVTITVRSF